VAALYAIQENGKVAIRRSAGFAKYEVK
jgi:hypothetical protein